MARYIRTVAAQWSLTNSGFFLPKLDMNTFCCSIDHNPFFRESRTTPMKSFFQRLHISSQNVILLLPFEVPEDKMFDQKCFDFTHTKRWCSQCSLFSPFNVIIMFGVMHLCDTMHRLNVSLFIALLQCWASFDIHGGGVEVEVEWSSINHWLFPLLSLSVSCSSPWFPLDHLNLKPLVLVQPPI